MDVNELQKFFADKAAEISIDFIESERSDCRLNISIAISGEEFMTMGYDLPFSQADGFIKELQAEVDRLKPVAKEE